jgi:TonB family protein
MKIFLLFVLLLEVSCSQKRQKFEVVGRATPPVLLNRVEPGYPKELQDKGIGGTIVVRFTISKEGLIVGTPILVKKAHPTLVREVYFAMGHWRFEPVLILGKPTSFETEMVINFVPPKKKKKNPAP